MKEVKLPVEVRLVLRDLQHLDTFDLLRELQDIADEWYWRHIPTIPCAVVSKGQKNERTHQ